RLEFSSADVNTALHKESSCGIQGPRREETRRQGREKMKRLVISLSVVAVAALASAEDALADVKPEPLQWATGSHIDWSKGGLLAAFGSAGALFTVFTLVGGVVPGTAGQPDLAAEHQARKILGGHLQDPITRA